jgi:site-specific recombinase XerD
MDKPADPATPFAEVYQAFYIDLAREGTKPSTIARYRYNIGRFEQWLIEKGHPVTLAALDRANLIAYRQYLETLPQQPRGSSRALADRQLADEVLEQGMHNALTLLGTNPQS